MPEHEHENQSKRNEDGTSEHGYQRVIPWAGPLEVGRQTAGPEGKCVKHEQHAGDPFPRRDSGTIDLGEGQVRPKPVADIILAGRHDPSAKTANRRACHRLKLYAESIALA